jgi:hypothetical protein
MLMLCPPIEKHYARDGKEIGAAPRRLASVFHVSIVGIAVTAMLAPPMAIQAMVSLAARPTFAAPLRSAKSPGEPFRLKIFTKGIAYYL